MNRDDLIKVIDDLNNSIVENPIIELDFCEVIKFIGNPIRCKRSCRRFVTGWKQEITINEWTMMINGFTDDFGNWVPMDP